MTTIGTKLLVSVLRRSGGRMSRRACKICRKSTWLVATLPNNLSGPDDLEVCLCSTCGLLFIGTELDEEDLERAYESLDSDHYYDEIATNTALKAADAAHDLERLFDGGPEARVLDVGCGYGQFLEAVSARWPAVPVVGQELSAQCARVCQSKGFSIHVRPLSELEGPFSLIVMLDVAEHLPDPVADFASSYELLREGGHLYLHTPRRCSWDTFFLLLTTMPGLQRPAMAWLSSRLSILHLQLWSDESLRLALQSAGFNLVYLRRRLELSWSIRQYIEVYLGRRRLPRPLLRAIEAVSAVLFVHLRLLRNKAVVLAAKSRVEEGEPLPTQAKIKA